MQIISSLFFSALFVAGAFGAPVPEPASAFSGLGRTIVHSTAFGAANQVGSNIANWATGANRPQYYSAPSAPSNSGFGIPFVAAAQSTNNNNQQPPTLVTLHHGQTVIFPDGTSYVV